MGDGIMITAEDRSVPARFRTLVAARYGLHFDDSRLAQLAEIVQRQAELRAQTPAHYLADLEMARPGLDPPAEDLTVGETYFFRNTDQFDALREVVLPERLAARKNDRRIALLSAGCSSGEEAYTLAMVARDAVPQPSWTVDIRAVDVNPAALRRAERARYGTWALRETPPEAVRRWFTPHGRDMVLADELRGSVRFERCNLADSAADIWAPAAYDVVFCRNVIMYFTPAVQREVIARLARSLAPGGYLFLGHAETLRGLTRDFHLINTNDTFYYRLKDARDESEPAPHVYALHAPPSSTPPPTGSDADWFGAIGAASERIARLSRRSPEADVPKAEDLGMPGPTPEVALVLELVRAERFVEALALVGNLPAGMAGDPDVVLVEAALLVHAGRIAAAAELCTRLVAADELNAGATYLLGLCLEAVGDTDHALSQYARAIHLDAAFAMPRLRRGMLARRANVANAAKDLSEAAVLLETEDSSRLLLFGGGFGRAALIALCASESALAARGTR